MNLINQPNLRPNSKNARRRLDQPARPNRRRDHRALAPGAVGGLRWGSRGVPCCGWACAGAGSGELRGGVYGKVAGFMVKERRENP